MMTAPEPDRIVWRTSSYSNGAAACVEVGWRTSSYSQGGSACVEVAPTPNAVLVCDSKHRTGPALTVPTPAWQAFLTTLSPTDAALVDSSRAQGRATRSGLCHRMASKCHPVSCVD